MMLLQLPINFLCSHLLFYFNMQFHLNFTPEALPEKINYQHKIMLIGSCFTENIGNKLRQLKFNTLENPHGILFNPDSISTAMADYCERKLYTQENLFFYNELKIKIIK